MARDRNRRGRSRAAFAAAGVFLAAALALIALLAHFEQAANPSPSPNGTVQESVGSSGEPEFTTVDWDYWKGVNPDVIGWITIPGTDINHPVLQAHASDPDHYLHYDVYGDYNPHGAIYLDAECEEYGLSSRNAVILGHSSLLSGVTTRFGYIASYKDASFASEHDTVLIQTPTAKMRYKVRFANIVKGWEPTKRTSFESDADYRNWYDTSRDGAAMVLDGTTEPNQVISLVSCSYNFWKSNERTVVTTSIENGTETISAESSQSAPAAE